MPGAEAASGRGQLCSPPRRKRKGKAKSEGHAPRSVAKGTPGIAEKGAPTGGARAEIPAESSTARQAAPHDLGQGDKEVEENLASLRLSARGRLISTVPVKHRGQKEAWRLPYMPAQTGALVGGCRHTKSRANMNMGEALSHHCCQSFPWTCRALDLPKTVSEHSLDLGLAGFSGHGPDLAACYCQLSELNGLSQGSDRELCWMG